MFCRKRSRLIKQTWSIHADIRLNTADVLTVFVSWSFHHCNRTSSFCSFAQTTNFKVKNIWGGNASPCLWLNPPMAKTSQAHSQQPGTEAPVHAGTCRPSPPVSTQYAYEREANEVPARWSVMRSNVLVSVVTLAAAYTFECIKTRQT